MSPFFGTYIEALEDAVLVTDARLTVVACNAALERLAGRGRQAVVGAPATEVLAFLHAPRLEAHLRQALAGEVARLGEVRYDATEGRGEGWVDARYAAWHDEDGKVAGVVGFHADVTEHRRHAAVMRALEATGQSLSSSLDLNEALDTIVGKAREVMGADSALVVSWDGRAPEFTVMRAAGRLSEEYAKVGRIPIGRGPVGRAIVEAGVVTTANILTDARMALSPERRHEVEVEGFRAVAAAPLRSKGRVHGALVVHYWTERGFSEDELAPLALLADQAAVAIDNARLYAEATGRAARLREFVAVSQTISASLDTTDVMQRIVRAAAGMRPGALSAVHVHDPDRRLLRTTANSSDELAALPAERAADAGLPGLVAERHAPVLIAEPTSHPRTLRPDWWSQRPRATYYGVPIAVGDTFVGVLDYILPEGLPGQEEQEALNLLAAQAGVAIRNAGLYQAERTQAERVRALAAVNQRMSSALDLDPLLQTISASAAQLAHVRFASFWLADEVARTLTFAGGSVGEIAGDFPQRVVGYDAGAVGWVARHHTPLAASDVFAEPRMIDLDWWRRWGLRAIVAYPVLAGQELLAVLVLSHSEPIRFDDDTTDLIEMFVAQASVAIQNARLYRAARRRRDVAEGLAHLGRGLTSTLEREHIAAMVSRGLAELLGVGGSTLYRAEADGRLRVVAAFGTEAERVRDLVLEPGEGVSGRAVLERRVVTTPNILAEPGVYLSPSLRARLAGIGLRAAIGAPLIARDRVIGAITLVDRGGRELVADELQILQAFADQAALALDNAELYESARDSLARLKDTQAQLVQAAKMSALGQLVSGVAHELNNPLSVVIGYGQLLLSREIPPAMRRPIELMVSQSDRMAKIVRNLLFFARQRPPERAAVDVHQVLEHMLALRLNQLTLSRISVEKDFDPDVPVIAGDSQQLEQVFLNLVLNAEQAILESKASGRIGLRTRLREDGGAVLVQVTDDGSGIPPEMLSRVFEPFFTTKAVGAGTGLGLSVSYGIVQEHGGRLSVQSQPGETVFTVELPAVQPPVLIDASIPVRPLAEGAGRVALLVEDETSVREMIETLLREHGWRVEQVAGGREGVERVHARRYDLIVCDMRMPDGDGEEFYHAVVELDAAHARRFIFVTGDTANLEARRFLQGTGVPVIEKPFRTETFADAVRRVLTGG
ncbi:MAG TPA: GAF domain-containing protein [Methylomirabilota bacterium]|nr:GAF domain-containing protein [Methylomirabilota bacterium]